MKVALTSLLAATALLAGCGGKPPGCADSAVTDLIKEMLIEDTSTQLATALKTVTADQKTKVTAIVKEYFNGLKVEMTDVVNDGYNADAKKYRCAGKLSVTTPLDTYKVNTEYTTQKTEDSRSGFLLQVGQYRPMYNTIDVDLGAYMTKTRTDAAAKNEADAAALPKEPIVYQTSQTQEAEAKAVTAATTPDGFVKYAKADGELLIKKTGDQAQFKITSSRDQHSCEMEGTATMSSDTQATYKPDAKDQCTVRLKFGSGQVEVTTQACDGFCGMQAGGSMDGTYKR